HEQFNRNDKLRQKRRPEKDIEESEDDEESPTLGQYLISLGRDILIAVIVMAIIIGSLWGYTGNWPPMVVIESNSMMHGSDSNIGVIDTGDLVLVKKTGENDIKSYVEGQKSNYETYGSFGDVIIFKKNGLNDTPVIHRAVLWVEYNASGHNNKYPEFGSFDVPALGQYNITKTWISNYKPNGGNLSINLMELLTNFRTFKRDPHSGFLTKGDNNIQVDQLSTLRDAEGRAVEPIKTKWVVGKAEGELPWFGLIKLFVGGETGEPGKAAPPTSVNMLIVSIALIIIIPIVLDISFSIIGKRMKKKREEAEDDEDIDEGASRRPLGYGRPSNKSVYPGRRGDLPIYERNKKEHSEPHSRLHGQRRKSVKLKKEQEFDNGSDAQIVRKDDLFKKIR
ncbi:MAG: S26 family signal peptidase, partial [Candidatus Thorarchaeota archaeon]